MANVNELWKPLPGFDEYKVSSLGKIKGLRGDLKKIYLNKNGYFTTSIQVDKKPVAHSIHRLVALTFIPNPEPLTKTVVNHKNRDKTDNRADNLEWVTPKENSIHAANCKAYKNQKGIICLNNESEDIERFVSINNASIKLDIPTSSIYMVLKRKILQTHGYYFEYDDERETITSGTPNNKKYYKKVNCLDCGNEFEQVTHNKKFCSTKCADKYSAKHAKPNCKCSKCGNPLHRKPYYLKKNKNVFCSKACNSKFKKGKPLPQIDKIDNLIKGLSNTEKAKLMEKLKKSI